MWFRSAIFVMERALSCQGTSECIRNLYTDPYGEMDYNKDLVVCNMKSVLYLKKIHNF